MPSLAKHFSPPNLRKLPLVTDVLEGSGKPPNLDGAHDDSLMHILHYADWGSLTPILNAVARVMDAAPKTQGTIRVRRKRDGKLLHIITVSPKLNRARVIDASPKFSRATPR